MHTFFCLFIVILDEKPRESVVNTSKSHPNCTRVESMTLISVSAGSLNSGEILSDPFLKMSGENIKLDLPPNVSDLAFGEEMAADGNESEERELPVRIAI